MQQVAAGADYSLFLDTNGDVWACGYNADGQLGDGLFANQLTPVEMLTGITDISAGAAHAMASS